MLILLGGIKIRNQISIRFQTNQFLLAARRINRFSRHFFLPLSGAVARLDTSNTEPY
jgi:hypothetical protein